MELLTSLKAQSELDTYIIVQYSLVQYSLVQYITDRRVGKQTDRKADNIRM